MVRYLFSEIEVVAWYIYIYTNAFANTDIKVRKPCRLSLGNRKNKISRILVVFPCFFLLLFFQGKKASGNPCLNPCKKMVSQLIKLILKSIYISKFEILIFSTLPNNKIFLY